MWLTIKSLSNFNYDALPRTLHASGILTKPQTARVKRVWQDNYTAECWCIGSCSYSWPCTRPPCCQRHQPEPVERKKRHNHGIVNKPSESVRDILLGTAYRRPRASGYIPSPTDPWISSRISWGPCCARSESADRARCGRPGCSCVIRQASQDTIIPVPFSRKNIATTRRWV